MKTIKKGILFLVLTFGILCAQRTLIYAGSMIDGEVKKMKTKQTIVVENGVVVDVTSGYLKAQPGEAVYDLKNTTVTPGWMDLHVHLGSQSSPQSYSEDFYLNPEDFAYRSVPWIEKTLLAGFTTVRDVGGEVVLAARNAVNNGYINGPRIFSAGRSIGTTGGHADPSSGLNRKFRGDPGPHEAVVNGVDDAMKAVRKRYKEGSDLIKITATGGVLSVAKNGQNPQFTEEEIRAIVETANDYEMHVAAHAHGVEGMQRAIRAGVRTIEHGTLMDKPTARLMKQYGTYYVPTVSAGEFVYEKAKEPGYFPEIVRPKALEIGPKIKQTLGMAYKEGDKIAFGTDMGVSPHGENADEFVFMVEAGMKPIDAIFAATSWEVPLSVERLTGLLGQAMTPTMIMTLGVQLSSVRKLELNVDTWIACCLLYTSPSPRDLSTSRMPSSA